MKLSDSVKPISYLKAHASEILREVNEEGAAYVITQNGEAKAVLQDIKEYEANQEALALLKLLSLSVKDAHEGNVKTAKRAFSSVRKRIKD